ncbi:MAG: hypothetical protein V3W18_06210 [candidate division Zixibacteria bacterium]
MDKKKKTIGLFIIASAIVWGVTIISCSMKLKGTECFGEITTILSTGAALHLIFIWGPLAARLKKLYNEE